MRSEKEHFVSHLIPYTSAHILCRSHLGDVNRPRAFGLLSVQLRSFTYFFVQDSAAYEAESVPDEISPRELSGDLHPPAAETTPDDGSIRTDQHPTAAAISANGRTELATASPHSGDASALVTAAAAIPNSGETSVNLLPSAAANQLTRGLADASYLIQ